MSFGTKRRGVSHRKPGEGRYGAEITEVDGIKFKSGGEADRYTQLKTFEALGVIADLKTQPPFTLVPKFVRSGVKFQDIVYSADFSYITVADNTQWVEDWKKYGQKVGAKKGVRDLFITPESMVSIKSFLYRYPDINFILNSDLSFIPAHSAGSSMANRTRVYLSALDK